MLDAWIKEMMYTGIFHVKSKLNNSLKIPLNEVYHRINDDSLLGLGICKQVGISAALPVKKLVQTVLIEHLLMK